MPWASTIGSSEVVIDDTNFQQYAQDQFVDGELMSRGMWERDSGYGSWGNPVPESLLVPESEWKDRIEEMERTKTRISDMCKAAGLGVKNQNQTNYCWVFGVTYAVEVLRVVQGEPMVRLSPASVGGPIKNYKNHGGWGDEALRYFVEHGCVPESMWPEAAINRRYDTPESREERKKYRVHEWMEGRPRSERELISLLLNRIPCAVGYNWWRHLVCAVDPVYLGGNSYGIRIANSWSENWGEKGYGILKGSRHLPDGIAIPRTTTPGGG